mmetsp:Transcript_34520/g.78804  ORF Transcript_34520/g.78804 Transcript_34520/m.78804 type:complete len:84 (-) Transcript_34520:11-262(-)
MMDNFFDVMSSLISCLTRTKTHFGQRRPQLDETLGRYIHKTRIEEIDLSPSLGEDMAYKAVGGVLPGGAEGGGGWAKLSRNSQ